MSLRVWLGRQVRPRCVRMGTPELNCNKRAHACPLCVLPFCALCTGSAIIGRIDLLMAQYMVRDLVVAHIVSCACCKQVMFLVCSFVAHPNQSTTTRR